MFHLVTGLYGQYNSKSTLNILLIGPSEAGKTSFIERLKLNHKFNPKGRGGRRQGGESGPGRGHEDANRTRTRQRLDRSRIAPTVGQNVLDLDLPSTRLTLHFWDLGGASQLRRIWKQYYDEADLVIFMVDGQRWADLAREEEEERGMEDGGMNGSNRKGKGRELSRDVGVDRLAREDAWDALRSTSSALGNLPLLILVNKLDEPSSEVNSSSLYHDDSLGSSLSPSSTSTRDQGMRGIGMDNETTIKMPPPPSVILESVRTFFIERIAKWRAIKVEESMTLGEGPRKLGDALGARAEDDGGEEEGGRGDESGRSERGSSGARVVDQDGDAEGTMWEDVDVLGISALDGNGITHAMEWLKSRALSIKGAAR